MEILLFKSSKLCVPAFTDPKKWMRGNGPEDWLEFVDYVCYKVNFPNEIAKHECLSDIFAKAFKVRWTRMF